MPLFISDEEFRRCADDAGLVADKADAFIRGLYSQIETIKADADARSITLEQTCSLNEQKCVSLSAEYASLQSQLSELNSSLEQRSSEIVQLQTEKQKRLLQSIEKDGEIERLTRESSELHKSKRQLMEMLEQKDLEVSEKNSTIKSYLDKIVHLTENSASKEASVGDLESELGRLRATSARLLQEKELLERHNKWLNEELTAKVDSVIQLRRENAELEADMSSKLADVEKKFKESSTSSKLHQDRVKELEDKLASMERELLSTKDAAGAAEEHLSAEISTVTKLANLYKESSEEWSKKAGELEGVIKALETHLNQVESELKDRLEKELLARKEVEKESADLREKLQTTTAELETLKKESQLKELPLSSLTTDLWVNSVDITELVEDDRAIVPRIPAGVSGTALAASLLKDGWTLAKIYAKYQEAVDALRHEQLGRKQTQAILERVLYEIEEKAGVIMDEREEHERLLEAYSTLNQKLQHSLSEHSSLETTIQELKANLKRQERDYAVAQNEIVDLQKQVAILLKECRDVQLRCGSVGHSDDDEMFTGSAVSLSADSNAENILSERLLNFKDINGLVEQNVQLRSLVRNLSDKIEEREAEIKDKYEKELQMRADETASKVNAVLLRAEEQAHMIEKLHNSVAMYKKLYEEEHKLRSYPTHPTHPQDAVPEQGSSREVMLLRESTHDTSRKSQEKAFERLKNLEDDLAKSRNDIISLRTERDKLALEAQFAQEKLTRYMKEFEQQKEEHNGVLARNVEFSQLIVDYQRKLRESAESSDASNELSRKLTMEVAILKHEKEILQNAEKRASDEVRSLSERVHRLQASLDTIQSTEDVREEARGIEKRKQEEYINKIEREWAEVKKELQEERDNVRKLTLERESTLKNAMRQAEELSKELANALQSVAVAESRAAIAEARLSDLKKVMESPKTQDSDSAEGGSSSSSEKILANFREEIEKLRIEAQASKDHMLQYKNIAQLNEEALKEMESAHENFKNESDKVKRSLEDELRSLRERVNELERECKLKTEEAISATTGKEEALAGAFSEISSLKNDCSDKLSQILVMESQMSALKEDLEREHQRWRAAQDNYERQVILQSETIQELTKTSQALASAQQQTSELRKVVDTLTTENSELKSKWETEKLAIEAYKNEADKKYNEVNELNKMLHSRLEALHIKIADKERGIATGSSSQSLADEDGLQNVVNYLRRSKEIAETEMSLLKQEKLRLQSQLEVALKSAEAAQSALHDERTKCRESLFSEEDFKSLQLQVRELNLLRESNVQLREENRHNFEECQKLRETFQNVKSETENLERLLRDRDNELEACRKEIEALKMDKVHLEKRIDELVEKSKAVDVDDYNRLKESFQQMQVNLREKDGQLEEVKKLLSEKQNAVSTLEGDLARSRAELLEKENKIKEYLQTEASLKSDVDKLKAESERYKSLMHQARKKLQPLTKEKEEMSKEIQSLSKQLEEAQQMKKNTVDSAGEQAQREKEKEKDTRIQMLERTLERNREELKKEREDHHKEKVTTQKMKKTIIESRDNIITQKAKLSDELNKHRQALKTIQDEVEKLKNSIASQPEGTSTVQDISSTLLEDFASAYFLAVENFELVAQPASSEPESTTTDINQVAQPAQSLDSSTSSAGALIVQPTTSLAQTTPPPSSTTLPSMRTNEEKERRPAPARANIKTGRKIIRPSITRPKEPQGDVEMSEADEQPSNISSSQNPESQGNVTAPVAGFVRKRPSASVSSDTQEENLAPEETNSDLSAPKKLKASEEGIAEQLKSSEVAPTEDQPSDDVANLQQEASNKEQPIEPEKGDLENVVEQVEEPTADEQIPGLSDTDEKSEKPSETVISDDQLRDQTEQDIQRIVTESGGDREEGELVADLTDTDDTPPTDEAQAEQSVEPESSPTKLEAGEIDSSQIPEEESNEVADPIAETEKVIGSSSGTATEEASTSTTTADVGSSEQGGPTQSPTSDAGGKPVSPLSGGSTTINLQERARERARERQSGLRPGLLSSSAGRIRGRGVRGRGARGRAARGGQSPG